MAIQILIPPFKTIRNIAGDSTGLDTSLSSRYAGPAYAAYSRLRLRYGQYVSVAITAERDRGEAWRWDPKNQFLWIRLLVRAISALRNTAISALW